MSRPMVWVLCGVLGLIPLTMVHGQTTVHYDFEDGRMRGTAVPMKVPPKILTDQGNTFMQITGSAGDRHSIPTSKPEKNRSTVWMTAPYANMPMLSSATMHHTYRADLRFHDNTGSDGSVFELFQDGPQTGGYATKDGQGPVVRFFRTNRRDTVSAEYANNTKSTRVDLGTIPAGTWHQYKVVAVWSHDPQVGHLAIYLDGKQKLLVTGRDVNWARPRIACRR